MKPAPEFYAACVSAAGLPSDKCVFVDDLAENIDGARRAGLVGLHYVDTPGLVAALRKMGLPVDVQ
jgi:FMN phosphatase YigB (HAD superfamily)